MATVSVRYIVDDVEAAVDFYTTHLAFELLTSAFPAFADVKRGDSTVCRWAGRQAPGGARCRMAAGLLLVAGIGFISSSRTWWARLRRSPEAGLSFRSDIVTGPGGW